MTTPLFLLRCVQLGISIRDLDLLDVYKRQDLFRMLPEPHLQPVVVSCNQEHYGAFFGCRMTLYIRCV